MRWGAALTLTATLFPAPLRPQPSAPPAVAPQIVDLPRPLPAEPFSLSSLQAVQLAALLRDDAMMQGLQWVPPVSSAPLGNDALIAAALEHARAVHAGRLDLADFQSDWGLRPAAYDPMPGFADAVRRNRLAGWIASLPPPYAGYDGLRKGFDTYRDIVTNGGWPELAKGPDLAVGVSGPRVIALRQRLAVEDKNVLQIGDSFDEELREGVRRAQRRYGLNPSGVMSFQTRAALNVPAADRVRQIMANMERWRWLPQNLPRDRIQVNIAAAVLTVFDGDTPVQSMRAVTGRPGDETPMLSSTVHSIVINPPWNVPTSIAKRELWPKERRHPGYLKRAGFKVVDGIRLRQAAGDQSALGRFKFDFDNPYSVYLHDTPSRAKFASFSRLASHGCVRLEKPAKLAELLLKGETGWTPVAVASAIAKGDTVRAQLPRPMAVYLLYWTAFASGAGQMNFRSDPYQWDAKLAAKITARSVRPMIAAR